MNRETKFLHLRTPAMLGESNQWMACVLAGRVGPRQARYCHYSARLNRTNRVRAKENPVS